MRRVQAQAQPPAPAARVGVRDRVGRFPDKARLMFAQSINLHELGAWDPFPRASVALLELQESTLRGTRGLGSAAVTQAGDGQLLRKSWATAKPHTVGNGVKEAFHAPDPRRNPPKSRR